MKAITNMKGFKLCAGVLILALLLSLTGIPAVPVLAAQQSTDWQQKILEAEQLYTIGRFDEAISILTECLEKGQLDEQQKMRVYRLLGLSYIAKDFLEDARGAIRKLLDMVPHYMSDPVQDPPPFTRLVEEVKEQRQEEIDDELAELIPERKERKNTMWMIIGGGALAVGALVAVLVSGSGNGNGNGEDPKLPLPGPPDLP